MNAQIIYGQSWGDYTRSGALGSSALADWSHMSKAAWKARHLDGAYQSHPNAAMIAGSALDCLVTEGRDAFDRAYIVRHADIDGRTKAGKEWAAAAEGRRILDAQTYAEITAALPLVGEAITIAAGNDAVKFQTTFEAEICGLKIHTRPDIHIDRGNECHLPDLKYLNSLSFGKFDRDFCGSRYEIQSALAWGIGRDFGRDVFPSFLLVESGTIYPRVALVSIPQAICQRGWERIQRIAEEIAAEKQKPFGFCDPVDVREIELPAWAR